MKMYTQDQLDQVVDAFQAHKVLALPTDTVYGVGVLYGDLADLDHLKHAKHRPETKPIPMMVSNLEQMKQIAKVDARTEKLAQTFLPGPLTLVLPVSETLDLAYTNGKKTVAVRIPDEPELSSGCVFSFQTVASAFCIAFCIVLRGVIP